MAKGQKRSNREAKKPKAEKSKEPVLTSLATNQPIEQEQKPAGIYPEIKRLSNTAKSRLAIRPTAEIKLLAARAALSLGIYATYAGLQFAALP